MKYSHNSKLHSQKKWILFDVDQRLKYRRQFNFQPLAAAVCLLVIGFIGFQHSSLTSADHRQPRWSNRHNSWEKKFSGRDNPLTLIKDNSKLHTPKPGTSTTPPPTTTPTIPPPTSANVHNNVTTTYFWVGEEADSDNGGISNAPSAWDEQWQAHFGGVDAPTGRNGYLPGGFTPKENPFYFALPYNDFTEGGKRKSNATSCANSGVAGLSNYSWCKNTWVAISKNGKTVYAQWEDVGPFGEDDSAYVFGTAAPKNKQLTSAGLDLSPAAHDYLGLGDVDKTSWWFVPANNVPAGPWKDIVTTSKGDSNN